MLTCALLYIVEQKPKTYIPIYLQHKAAGHLTHEPNLELFVKIKLYTQRDHCDNILWEACSISITIYTSAVRTLIEFACKHAFESCRPSKGSVPACLRTISKCSAAAPSMVPPFSAAPSAGSSRLRHGCVKGRPRSRVQSRCTANASATHQHRAWIRCHAGGPMQGPHL